MRMLVLTLTPLLVAAAALASDGVLEINGACVNTGCFPGDSPGLPVEITQKGSYRLTSNLLSPNGVTAISIQSDAVTIDLGGFTIGPCTNVAALCPILAVAPGVLGLGADKVTIKNGIVEEFRSTGILLGTEARVQNVTVQDVQGLGMQVGPASVIQGCIASGSGRSGIAVGEGSTVEGSTARLNDDNGFTVGEGSVVRGNSASSNGSSGFRVATGSTVVQNSADSNGGAGFSLAGSNIVTGGGLARSNTAVANDGFGFDSGGERWGLIDNVANNNNDGGDQIRGGIEMGQNVCNGNLTCP